MDLSLYDVEFDQHAHEFAAQCCDDFVVLVFGVTSTSHFCISLWIFMPMMPLTYAMQMIFLWVFWFLGTASRYALAYELEFVMIVTEAASKVLFYKSAGFHVRSYPSQCEPRSSRTNSQAC